MYIPSEVAIICYGAPHDVWRRQSAVAAVVGDVCEWHHDAHPSPPFVVWITIAA